MKKNENMHRELATVKSLHNDLIPEEFPEGPYDAATHEEKLGKSSPWRPGQHITSAFTYEMRDFHEGLPRDNPGSHPTHDDREE